MNEQEHIDQYHSFENYQFQLDEIERKIHFVMAVADIQESDCHQLNSFFIMNRHAMNELMMLESEMGELEPEHCANIEYLLQRVGNFVDAMLPESMRGQAPSHIMSMSVGLH